MLDESFISKILTLSKPEYKEMDGRTYCTKNLHLIEPPSPKNLMFNSLDGLVQFLVSSVEDFKSAHVFVKVNSYDEVEVLSSLDPDHATRFTFATAVMKNHQKEFPFDKFIDQEDFIIKLQSLFVQDKITEKLLQIVGNIKEEDVRQASDDGVTQSVTASSEACLKCGRF